MHYAVLTDSLDLIEIILKAGGDPLLENELGHRAYEYCANDEVKKLLESYEKHVLKFSHLFWYIKLEKENNCMDLI